MYTRTANASSELVEPRVANAERLVAGDHRRTAAAAAALDVNAGRLLSVESAHVGVVAVETPRRARVGALRPRSAATLHTRTPAGLHGGHPVDRIPPPCHVTGAQQTR